LSGLRRRRLANPQRRQAKCLSRVRANAALSRPRVLGYSYRVMRRSRSGTSRLLAALLPVTLVWVFFACTLQCAMAAEPGCLDHEGVGACCPTVPDAPCEAVELSDAPEGCTIVVERAVLRAGETRLRLPSLDATPAIPGLVVESTRETRSLLPHGHSLPRPPPLDRLPTLQI
jgi:hypothetical protein